MCRPDSRPKSSKRRSISRANRRRNANGLPSDRTTLGRRGSADVLGLCWTDLGLRPGCFFDLCHGILLFVEKSRRVLKVGVLKVFAAPAGYAVVMHRIIKAGATSFLEPSVTVEDAI